MWKQRYVYHLKNDTSTMQQFLKDLIYQHKEMYQNIQTLCIGCVSIYLTCITHNLLPSNPHSRTHQLLSGAMHQFCQGHQQFRTYADSSLHQLRLQNIHQHKAHSTGLLYLAYISDRSQTSCHSCQGWRSQGCHCTGMADTILQVEKVVQNSLLHT